MDPVTDEDLQAESYRLHLAHLSLLADRALGAAAQLVEVTRARGAGQPDLRSVAASAAKVVSAASLTLAAATALAEPR